MGFLVIARYPQKNPIEQFDRRSRNLLFPAGRILGLALPRDTTAPMFVRVLAPPG